MHRSTTFVVALCRATQKLHKTLTQNASPCYFDPQIKFKDVLHLSLSQLLSNDKDVVQGKGEESLFSNFSQMKNIDLLGIPDTSLRGLNTRTALSVRKSNCEPTVDRILKGKRQMHRSEHRESIFKLAELVKVCQPRSFSISPFSHTCTNPCQIITNNWVSSVCKSCKSWTDRYGWQVK